MQCETDLEKQNYETYILGQLEIWKWLVIRWFHGIIVNFPTCNDGIVSLEIILITEGCLLKYLEWSVLMITT